MVLTQTEKTKERRRPFCWVFFLHFFLLPTVSLPRHAWGDIFPFSKRQRTSAFLVEKTHTTTTHKKQNNQEAIEIFTFYYASYTHNVYRAIRIYDCGKYTFRGIRFARRSMDARFARVRIERWSERDCRSRGKNPPNRKTDKRKETKD